MIRKSTIVALVALAWMLALPLRAEVIEQPLGTQYVGESVPTSVAYLMLITRIEDMTRSDALALAEDRIGMSIEDAARFVDFAVSEAQRLEAERIAARLDMLCTPAGPETLYQRLQTLQDLAENEQEESMILAGAQISRDAAARLQSYLDDRKLSTAYVKTKYRETYQSLRLDVRNHVDEECAAGGRL